ncbi:MAG: cation diffusion facilitator family transporter [Alphaproteobacteria bacterium]|nr:cation diffusion facilitator family transporter [Alphaproteobacteria bacterium]
MTNKNKLMMGASVASVAVATTLIFMKSFAFFITGSVAILASLFDSVQDLMTSAINFFTVRHSLQPADTKHRFGHGKAQGIGSFVQGLILLVSAGWLAFESVLHWGRQEIPTHSMWGISVILFTLVLTGLLIRFQMFVIRQTESLSIRADNAHYNGDLMMNLGVLISLVFSYIFSAGWIDCVFGVGVSLYLLKSALYILRASIAMLMDEELPKNVQHKIKTQLNALKEIKQIQDLRTRQSGCQIFIQMTLLLDGNMPLAKAHLIADKAESLIHEIYPDSEIMIHLEPEK